jgi:hypothetical protein
MGCETDQLFRVIRWDEGIMIQNSENPLFFAFLRDLCAIAVNSSKWKYRAIYSNDAQRTGQWSNVVEITVGA